MSRLFVFGLGYTAGMLSRHLQGRGWHVAGTTRDGRGGSVRFDDAGSVLAEVAAATHILSSVPPEGEGDPVLTRYGAVLADSGAWLGYLSSTGVYGDTGGAWVDEGAPTGSGRRGARAAADAAWLAAGARVLRLPGIYGPGRSPLDRVKQGRAHRVGITGQVFSRIHVDDLIAGIVASFDGPAGAYNLADDLPCDQDAVVTFAAELLGLPVPALASLDSLSPTARGFYAENRRVANAKAKRVLGWRPRFADYRLGLRALNAMTSPTPASAPPAPASSDQR
ncbi:Nucleoside-diphosphate-sugar epimerase [Sphingomonas gellani]|uniref:Nucleoside-diphosphate-sugar epimerase n=1 Tax=Sphingomonas gellani TaxID=1166340 RepID=A0A1H8AHN3_9SPHN|nr:NAD(P)-dependent oxidoreductase [Sphingomonas gellani]SEM70230.1 Nucleoside-diphosphate-sugar epimerase [Sphingomonas gellani]